MFELIFHPEAEAEILALASNVQGKALRALAKLEAEGHQLRYPDTAPIRDGLFELRAGGRILPAPFLRLAKGNKSIFYGRLLRKPLKRHRQKLNWHYQDWSNCYDH